MNRLELLHQALSKSVQKAKITLKGLLLQSLNTLPTLRNVSFKTRLTLPFLNDRSSVGHHHFAKRIGFFFVEN